MSDATELLSALIDREPVDPDMLAHVLEDPASRTLLVDFVRIRAAVNADEDEGAVRPPVSGYPLPAAGQHADSRLGAFDSGRSAPSGSVGSRWIRAAAVFALLAAGAGGGAWLERYVSRDRPPEPDRIVRLEPVPASGLEAAQDQPRRQQ
jgi:hypothetical protein